MQHLAAGGPSSRALSREDHLGRRRRESTAIVRLKWQHHGAKAAKNAARREKNNIYALSLSLARLNAIV